MGVVNVTPDSFSDGGVFFDARDPGAAVEHGLTLVAQGADLIDVGGESTRPGADRVPAKVERARVLPVIRALAGAGAVVSVDTMRAELAAEALAAGAAMVNDVSGGLADPDLPGVAAAAVVPYVLMHWRGHSRAMAQRATYTNVVTEVVAELRSRLDALAKAGLDPEQVVVDPGLGFAKTERHNWSLLADLPALAALGRPVLLGASRKSFLGLLLAGADGIPRPVLDRDDASAAVSALAAAAGVWCVRVHAVRPSADAVRVAAAIAAAPALTLTGVPGGRY
jgi:dihydropteroate synthase